MKTYQRLIKCLMWQGILSEGEAKSVIWAHQRGMDSWAACEAAAHYCRGGPLNKLIQDAFRNRHVVSL